MEKVRKKKVYTKFQKREMDYIAIPEIRLEGKWLEKLGFVIGSSISIQTEGSKMVITLDK